jgi:hypothetical protein
MPMLGSSSAVRLMAPIVAACAALTIAPFASSVQKASKGAADRAARGATRGLDRPLHLPRLRKGQRCPKTRGRPANAFTPFGTAIAVGKGPAYPLIDSFPAYQPNTETGVVHYGSSKSGGWHYIKVLWIVAPIYKGPLLIRGRQIDGSGPLKFQFPDDRRMRAALRMSSGSGTFKGWRAFPSATRLRGPGCYAYQIDGTTFSRIVVFKAAR